MLEQTDQIDIPEEEIRVDVYRSSGPGGQSVNTTDSAVRLTHVPTGIVVSCQNEKSQLQNKATAMVILKAKLLALKKAEERATLDELRGDVQASWGDQMRNYVLQPVPDGQGPADRVRDGQHQRGLRRRDRRLHRGRHPLAAWTRRRRRLIRRAVGGCCASPRGLCRRSVRPGGTHNVSSTSGRESQ
ncbi:MAG: peptide chain release factor-like protein [Nocardioidaceae bacterium]